MHIFCIYFHDMQNNLDICSKINFNISFSKLTLLLQKNLANFLRHFLKLYLLCKWHFFTFKEHAWKRPNFGQRTKTVITFLHSLDFHHFFTVCSLSNTLSMLLITLFIKSTLKSAIEAKRRPSLLAEVKVPGRS